jgi:WD40 repeat protein
LLKLKMCLSVSFSMKATELRLRYQSNQRDFQGADLQEENLAWTDLSGINLSEANLQNVNLSAAILKNAILKQANLTFANMSRVDLAGANLCGATLEGVNLSDACLEGIVYDTQTQWPKGFDVSKLQKVDILQNSKESKTSIATRSNESDTAPQGEQQMTEPIEVATNPFPAHSIEKSQAASPSSPWVLMQTLKAHRARINAFAISADNHWLISGSNDRVMNVWHLPTGKYHCSYTAHGNSVTSVAMSANQQWIASGCLDKKITLWTFKTQKLWRTLMKDSVPASHDAAVHAILFRSTVNELISAGADHVIGIWSVENGSRLSTLKGHQATVETLALSTDDRWLVSGSADKTVRMWDLKSRKPLRTLQGHQERVQSVAIAPQGQPILSGSADGIVKAWNWVSETELYSLRAHDQGHISLAIHPQGKLFASVSERSVKLWDLETGTMLQELGGCTPVAFSPDGTKLVTGGAQYTAKIWQSMS